MGFLRSPEVRARLLSQSTGINRHRTGWEFLKDVPVPLLNAVEQSKLAQLYKESMDDLIAGSGRKNAAFCQVLKDTAMRSGEAKRLQWTDIDAERNVLTLNDPEKGAHPRMWKVTGRLIGMLHALPKQSEQVFPSSLRSMKTTFAKTRRRLAATLQNPRLLKITFHTFRHWKATTLYHQTKDIYYVQQFLGHRDIRNTMVYINVERTLFGATTDDEFTVRVAEKPEEIKALLEQGFEYVCQKENLAFLRKRK